MNGNYDINNYSDEDCFTILNLNHPSDRELEMTILEFMDKYQEKSKRLYHFFESMYDRFFDDDENENEVEGFEAPGTKTITYADPDRLPENIPSDGIIPDGYIRVNVGTDRKPIYKMKATVTRDSSISVDRQQYENEQNTREYAAAQTASTSPRVIEIEGKVGEINVNEIKKDDVQQVTQTDYVKDKFKLNPVKRNTIFKMISVDSQFREDASTTNASSFTMNLSESIDNVISMKLYSVQIPYTWYTINSTFGSNFFYLKGNSPGIDNGDHDIKIEIPSGNYTPPQFADTIQGVFDLYKTGSKDISFGETSISYNTNNTKILFEFDLKKKYNETDYQLYFPSWSSPNVEGSDKALTIPSFLGYNHNYYYPYIAYSDYFKPETDTNRTIFELRTQDTSDSSANNYFTIYRYIGTSLSQSTQILDTIRINFSFYIEQRYTRGDLEQDINTQLRSNSLLDPLLSRFTRVNLNATNSYYEIAVKQDRTKTEHVDNSKLAIQFPLETSTGTNHIWTGKGSCFEFKQDIIELNEVVSETETLLTNYIIDISANIRIECTKPGYDVEENVRTITVLASNNPDGYLLSEYIAAINAAIQTMNSTTIIPGVLNNGEFNLPNTKFYINANDYATFDFDILRIFTQQDYVVDLTSCFLSSFPFSFNSSISDLSNNDFTRIISFSSVQSININSDNNTIVLRPKENSGNKNADPVELHFTTGTYNTLNSLITQINLDFGNFTDQDDDQIMNGSVISFSNSSISLLFNIRKVLTENDYKVTFDSNTWSNFLYFEPSYNLINFGTGDKSSISGSTKIFDNIITLSSSNNQFVFKPYINGVADSGGANDIIFEIDIGDYSRKQLKDKIQSLFTLNPLTTGSIITLVTNQNREYTNICMNINKTYYSEDYKLVFYDPVSFVTCNVGVVQNVTWDSTLGWILGFHSFTEYSLRDLIATDLNLYPNNLYSDSNYINSLSTSKKIAIRGDSALITTLYNYLLVVLDDFIQNHVNAGLITITSLENDIALPTYASRLAFQCDPITGQRVAVSATNNLNTNLSAKQLYAANQILEDKRTKTKSYASGPYLKDVFALIPLKLTGMTFGQTYMEFGGTLQNQDRKYFGPVRIQKLSVKLMNDKGSVVNLNGANWSFCLICEILNRSEE